MKRSPIPVRLLDRLPYEVKWRLVSQRMLWRYCHGLCRRMGWNTSQFGWWMVSNGPYKGINLEVWHTNQLARRIGIYEPSVSRWLTSFLLEQFQKSGPQRVWDIGANMGALSILSAKHGNGSVVAFEPLEENLSRLRTHLDRNPDISGRVRLAQTAVSDRDGEIEFSTPGPKDQCQIRDERIGLNWHPDAATVTVPTITLDSFMQGCNEAPDLIKIDVEGAEALVLTGARDVLSTYRPTLLVEVHGPEIAERCRTILESHDYEISVLGKRGLEKNVPLPGYGHIVATISTQFPRAERPVCAGTVRPK